MAQRKKKRKGPTPKRAVDPKSSGPAKALGPFSSRQLVVVLVALVVLVGLVVIGVNAQNRPPAGDVVTPRALASMADHPPVGFVAEFGGQVVGRYGADEGGNFDLRSSLPGAGPVEVRVVNQVMYVRATTRYWRSASLPTDLASTIATGWVNVGAVAYVTSEPVSVFLADSLGLNSHTAMSSAATLNGRHVVALHSGGTHLDSVVYVDPALAWRPVASDLFYGRAHVRVTWIYRSSTISVPRAIYTLNLAQRTSAGFGNLYPVTTNGVVEAVNSATLVSTWHAQAATVALNTGRTIALYSALHVSELAVGMAATRHQAVSGADVLRAARTTTDVTLVSGFTMPAGAGGTMKYRVTGDTAAPLSVCVQLPTAVGGQPKLYPLGTKGC